ncbi:MAG: DUF559 domain-containing protein [Paludibacteraceae bacterium]|nr:DUF559 domain-containing protein [Paludibacteraceae bacterium]
MECAICKQDFKSYRALSIHITQKHKDCTLQSYYDTYIQPNTEHKCKFCGKELKFLSMSVGYQKTCGDAKCSKKQEKETRLNLYDGKYECDESIRRGLENQKNTMLEKYGVEHNWSNGELREKCYDTCEKEYGSRTYNNPEGMKKSRIENNGSFMTKEMVEKSRNTKLEKYGDPFYLNTEKSKETRIKKYGRYSPPYIHDVSSWKNNCRADRLSSHVFRCNDCDLVFVEMRNEVIERRQANHQHLCPNCYTSNIGSKVEKYLLNEIHNFYDGEILENDRTILEGKELDIYIPEFKLAIEVNGMFWHKEDKDRHIDKTTACENKGIHLLHFWDYEVTEKQDIVIDKIKSCMGKNNVLFGRKCTINEIDNKTYKSFVNENHMQGYVQAKHKYGLFYKDELVAIGSFGKSRYTNEYELLRYCSKHGISILGGMKKLVSNFKKSQGIECVVSYADRRFTSSFNNVYGQYVSISKVGYKYFYGSKVFDRLQLQKHKLKVNPLTKDNYSDDLTEHEICNKSNIYRIYDCGQLKFIL